MKYLTKEWAIKKIIQCVKEHPEKHKTPDALVNTYSGMGGCPINYCEDCRLLILEFGLKKLSDIPGLKQGMWNVYIEDKCKCPRCGKSK